MTRPRARRRQSGLTLLEVMAASAMLAVFLMSVYTLVFGALRTRQAMEDNTLPYAIGPIVMQRISEDLRFAVLEPYDEFDAFRAKAETLGGEEVTAVDFVSAVRSRARVKIDDEEVTSAICEIGYRTRDSETRQGLLALYRREDFGVDGQPLEGGKFYKLVDGVRVFRVDFFDEDPGELDSDQSEGETEWDAKTEKRLPWGCRITLIIEQQGEVDDRGEPLGEPKVFEFVNTIPFSTRYDTADQEAAGNSGGANPPSGQ